MVTAAADAIDVLGGDSGLNTGHGTTVPVLRMAHRKWKETKQHQGTAEPGNMLGCCLNSFYFLSAILSTSTVQRSAVTAVSDNRLTETVFCSLKRTSLYLKSSDTVSVGFSDTFANPQGCHCSRRLLYYECCLKDVLVKFERHLLNSIQSRGSNG